MFSSKQSEGSSRFRFYCMQMHFLNVSVLYYTVAYSVITMVLACAIQWLFGNATSPSLQYGIANTV